MRSAGLTGEVRRRLTTTGIAAFASAIAAGPALAADIDLGPAALHAGPVLAGKSLVYAETSGNGVLLKRVAVTGGTATELAREFPRAAEARSMVTDLAASSVGFGAGITTAGVPGEQGARTIGGAFGAATRPFGDCGRGAGVSVLDDRVVSDTCGVVATSLSQGADDRRLAPPPARSPRLAGRLVSWVEGARRSRIVVVDAQSGERVTSFRLSRVKGVLDDYDLRRDGTLVISFGRHGDGNLVVTVAPSGRLRRVRAFRSITVAVRIRRSRIAFLQADIRGSRVGLVRLDGQLRVIARRVSGDRRDDFDFDGRRLAWRRRSQAGTRLHVRTLG